ncbi:SprT-like family protein [Jatrophihabitans sp. GAS493]|uniref:SprT-like domain-containing protein n=1 Tax=Jatrophihabitans sp. GAS493 TaxID=1907575 RepID=UPI000BB86DE2|nr:SprT-like domain-containing protein [Jatrophihabitans sp. GAS493]SOD73517.1 SprT-like family protein [Jatrophihabitans sp. GAS493]
MITGRLETALAEIVVISDHAELARNIAVRRTDGPVLAIVGGAGGMSAEEEARALALATDVVVPIAEELGACIVDGGTDSGVMRAIGAARARANARFPLVGVAVASLVSTTPGAAEERLDPNHSLQILVPGNGWGDESPWLSEVVGLWAGDQPSATLVINGGAITKVDVEHSITAGRSIVLAVGTGRTADDLAAQPPWPAAILLLEVRSSIASQRQALRSALTSQRPPASVRPTAREVAVRQFCEETLAEHGLTDETGQLSWKIKFGDARRTLGSCNHQTKTLHFSRAYIDAIPFEDSLRTVAHEVAHAIVGGRHGHDRAWRQLCILLGGDGEARYHGATE